MHKINTHETKLKREKEREIQREELKKKPTDLNKTNEMKYRIFFVIRNNNNTKLNE